MYYLFINNFIQQGCIKLIESDRNLIYRFQINSVILNILFIWESWKNNNKLYQFSQKLFLEQ